MTKSHFHFEKISDYLEDDDALTWVDLCDPDHHLLQELAGELVLQPLAVEDAIAHSERAKANYVMKKLPLGPPSSPCPPR